MRMKKVLLTFLLLFSVLAVRAQGFPFDLFGFGVPQQTRTPEKKVRLAYDVYFQFDFDNREFSPTEDLYTRSGTLFTAALTPSVGVEIQPTDEVRHQVMLGIAIMKNMGENPVTPADAKLRNWDLLREITLYYHIQARLENTLITAYAGVFPRRFMQGEYGKSFFSDSLKLVDRNLEGALLRIRRPRAMYEFGCDWMGMFGPGRRERFMLFSTGEAALTDWLSLGWALNGYHYACTAEYGHVADNILAQPFVKFDLGTLSGMQELSAKLSLLAGLQRLRQLVMDFSVPYGGELQLGVRQWNVGLDNRTYFGTSLMPFYNQLDEAGRKYGSDFYWGAPLYRIHSQAGTAWNTPGWYDRAEIYWQPHIADFVDLRLSAVFHFTGDGAKPFLYCGSQQGLTLVFDLQRLLYPTRTVIVRSRTKRNKLKTHDIL